MAFECVPDVDCVVVVAGEEDSAWSREVDRVDAEQDRFLRVLGDLAIYDEKLWKIMKNKQESLAHFFNIGQVGIV